jgi:hypothetical protein
MDNVQKVNHCINTPSSLAFRFYFIMVPILSMHVEHITSQAANQRASSRDDYISQNLDPQEQHIRYKASRCAESGNTSVKNLHRHVELRLFCALNKHTRPCQISGGPG